MFTTVIILFALVLVLAILTFYYVIACPPTNPRNIPSVPFYVTLIPLFKDVDQEETYRHYLQKPLQTDGAVKIFFGGRWNILVTRPSFVAEVFKNEDIYQKSGNQKKIPYSVMAEYTGINIISSYGENWRLYQKIIKPGLQKSFSTERTRGNTRILCNLIEKKMGFAKNAGDKEEYKLRVFVPELLQRYTLANLSQVVLGTNFKTLEDENSILSKLQLSVKREIFNPIFLNFPFLDKLSISSRLQARQLVKRFVDELTENIVQSRQGEINSLGSSLLGERDWHVYRTAIPT